MHFLDKRVNVICEELKKLKVKQKFKIDDWKYKEGNYIHITWKFIFYFFKYM